MRSVELGKVGKKIRALRKEQKLNLQDVAEKSGITAGLLSRIENFRTLPSIPVLYKISIALEVPMSELVDAVGSPKAVSYILVRNGEGETDSRDDSAGLTYESLINVSLTTSNIMVNIVKVGAGAYREPVANDSMELIYVVSGHIKYGLKDNLIELHPGDTLYFDGSIPHSVENLSTETEAILFKVYMLNNK